MGQTNEAENPSLILENLQNTTIEDENDTLLEKSFYIIRSILSEYKLYKDIISKNQKNIDNKEKNKKSKKEVKKIYLKEELMNIDKNKYDKNILDDVEHKLERIKKWVKMTKYTNNPSKNQQDIILENNDKAKNMNKKNKIPKKLILSNYSDYEIESGIFKFYQNKSSKFIQRVKKGPPDCFRWCSWCILNYLPQDRTNLIYENYTNMALEKENKDRIIRDIERTFSQKKREKKELREMETSLYKILKAFWNLDKVIGYCQGMNLIVGFLLIVSNYNERDSFYLLTSMFSNTFKTRKKYDFNIRGLFYDEFPLLNLLNYIFENLLERNCPQMKEHLETLGITIDLWMGRWFHTLFTIVLPINWCKRVWDNIFSDNIFFLVKFGICFSIMLQEDFLKMEDEEQVLNNFKNYEKFSLCYDNEELNKKCDLNKIIEKSQKINIDIDYYLKNYEKLNPGFIQKLNEIGNIKYEFFTHFIRKATYSTVLFSEEDNTKGSFHNKTFKNNSLNLKNENSKEKEIILNLTNKEKKINNQNKKNKIPQNLKNLILKKNSDDNINKINLNDSSNDYSPLKDINIINNNNGNNSNEEINNDIIKQELNNENIKETCDSVNEENLEHDNIIKKNINLHKFENFLNRNRLDIFSNKKAFKTFEKKDHFHFPSLKGRNESIGLHIPNEEDISTFIGKNKFKNRNKEKNVYKNIQINKEKIDQ